MPSEALDNLARIGHLDKVPFSRIPVMSVFPSDPAK